MDIGQWHLPHFKLLIHYPLTFEVGYNHATKEMIAYSFRIVLPGAKKKVLCAGGLHALTGARPSQATRERERPRWTRSGEFYQFLFKQTSRRASKQVSRRASKKAEMKRKQCL